MDHAPGRRMAAPMPGFGGICSAVHCRGPSQFREAIPIMDIFESIREQIESNPVILYMKGSPNQPQCGFSARSVQALMACGERFAYVDILTNPDIRANLPKYADWPTFPQLWVKGELVGGCDIITELYESGELKRLVQEATAAA
jgi:monothiol glutaredoxin